ncbi:hypothetical protein ACWCQB_38170 [Streptomyces hirsutus]
MHDEIAVDLSTPKEFIESQDKFVVPRQDFTSGQSLTEVDDKKIDDLLHEIRPHFSRPRLWPSPGGVSSEAA